MRVLIIEANPDLAKVWEGHLSRQGAEVSCALTAEGAHQIMNDACFDVVVMNAELDGKSVALADFLRFRCPDARVVFVTSSSFFSDGTLFELSPNAHACIPASTSPEDLASLVEYHGRAAMG